MKKLVFAVMFFAIGDANAGVYFTDNAGSADVWVTVTNNAGAADCWIYSGDIVRIPSGSDIWVKQTDNTAATDKWVIITDNLAAASDLSCLTAK